eukprot:SAG22_NODE_14481_length_373_cov_1.321168_1_plen_53_part_01
MTILMPTRYLSHANRFNPFHNAGDEYFLVNGTLAGSWQGLDERVVIINWGAGD